MVREAGDEGRAVVKNVGLVFGAVGDGLLEGVVFFPPFGDGFFVFRGFAAGSNSVFHRYIISYSSLFGPVFKEEMRHEGEMFRVVSDENEVGRAGVGGYKGIEGADRGTIVAKISTNFAIVFGGD